MYQLSKDPSARRGNATESPYIWALIQRMRTVVACQGTLPVPWLVLDASRERVDAMARSLLLSS